MPPQLLWFTQIPPSLHSPVKNVSLIAIQPSSSNWNCFHVTIMNKWQKDIFLIKRKGLFFLIFRDMFAKFDIVSHALSVLQLLNFSSKLSGIFACLGLLLPLWPLRFGISAALSLSVDLPLPLCVLASPTITSISELGFHLTLLPCLFCCHCFIAIPGWRYSGLFL